MTIDISKFWLGMDNQWLMNNTDTSYPRYNIVENRQEGSYRIEVAVPGWGKKELEVVHESEVLLVKGNKERKLGEHVDDLNRAVLGRALGENDHRHGVNRALGEPYWGHLGEP